MKYKKGRTLCIILILLNSSWKVKLNGWLYIYCSLLDQLFIAHDFKCIMTIRYPKADLFLISVCIQKKTKSCITHLLRKPHHQIKGKISGGLCIVIKVQKVRLLLQFGNNLMSNIWSFYLNAIVATYFIFETQAIEVLILKLWHRKIALGLKYT